MHLAAHFSPELELQYTLFFRLCCRRTAGSWPVDPVDVDVDDAGGGRMCVVGDAVRAQERGGQHGGLALGEALILLRLQALSVSWAHRDESAHGVVWSPRGACGLFIRASMPKSNILGLAGRKNAFSRRSASASRIGSAWPPMAASMRQSMLSSLKNWWIQNSFVSNTQDL